MRCPHWKSTAEIVQFQLFLPFLSLERGGIANCDSCRPPTDCCRRVRASGTIANETDTLTRRQQAAGYVAIYLAIRTGMKKKKTQQSGNRERQQAKINGQLDVRTLKGCVTKSYIINFVAIHTRIICPDFQCFSKIKNSARSQESKRATIKCNIKPNWKQFISPCSVLLCFHCAWALYFHYAVSLSLSPPCSVRPATVVDAVSGRTHGIFRTNEMHTLCCECLGLLRAELCERTRDEILMARGDSLQSFRSN